MYSRPAVAISALSTGNLLSALGAKRASTTPAPNGIAIAQQAWYTYDGENRTVINLGHLYNGQVSLQGGDPMLGYGPWYSGYMNLYDAAGNVTGKINGYNGLGIQRMLYTERGQLSVTFNAIPLGTNTWGQGTSLPWSVISEQRYYDAAGRLSEIRNYFGAGQQATNTSGVGPGFVEVPGWLQHRTTFGYDNDNLVNTQSEYGRIGLHWVDPVMTTYSGNATTALVPQSTDTSVLGLLSTTSTTHNLAGRSTNMTYQQSNVAEGQAPYGVPLAFTHTYTYTDLKRDAYLDNLVTGTSSDSNFKPSTSSSTYTAYGERKAIKEDSKATGVADVWRYFSYGADGQILTRYDGKITNGVFDQGYTVNEQKSNRHHYAFVNGQQVGTVDDIGRMEVLSQMTAYDSGMTGTNVITVQAGDTLESLAQRAYGNSSYWYVIAGANGLHDNNEVANAVGLNLKAPDVKTSRNDSSTFKPYNPAEIVGDTTPNLTYIAPPKAGCSAIAMLIRVVTAVMIAAAVATGQFEFLPMLLAGSGSEAFAQTVEISEDRRAGYDIGGIAAAGVMAALPGTSAGKGLATLAGRGASALTRFGFRALTAGIQSVGASLLAPAVNGAIGRDTHFSWKEVAVGAATAAITSGISAPGSVLYTPPSAFSWGAVATEALRSVVRSGVQYGVRKAITGEAHWNTREVLGTAAIDAAGAALGMRRADDRARRAQPPLAMTAGELAEFAAAGGDRANPSRESSDGTTSDVTSDPSAASRAGPLAAGGRLIAQGYNGPVYRMPDGTLVNADGQRGRSVSEGEWDGLRAQYDQVQADIETAHDGFYTNAERQAYLDAWMSINAGLGAETAAAAPASSVATLPKVIVKGVRSDDSAAVPSEQEFAAIDERYLPSIPPRLLHAQAMFQNVDRAQLARNLALTHGAMVGPVDPRSTALNRAYGNGVGMMALNPFAALVYDVGSARDPEVRLRNTVLAGAMTEPLLALASPFGARYSPNVVNTRVPVLRPTWRQSEFDVGAELIGQGYSSQTSFKGGVEVPYGTKGSTRPEYYRAGASIEVKNYNVETAEGRSNLVGNVSAQARHRAENLPAATQQIVHLDVRGQVVTRAQLNDIIARIVSRSNGAIQPQNIEIIR